MSSRQVTRRQVLKAAASAIAAPYFVPARVLGADAPSKQITMGFIGVGWMGTTNLGNFLKLDDVRVLAAADVDGQHLSETVAKINTHHKNEDCRGYKDFRELLARGDIDAVCISTPDHWHAIPAVQAARAKKDIYCEKPLSHTFAEGVAMVQAAEQNQRIWQTGSWQRSLPNFRQAAELVLNGYIGKVKRVEVGLKGGHDDLEKTGSNGPNTEPPAHVDYNFWLGPAAEMPFNNCRFHKNWRWNYNFGGGQLLDWIGHHCDIAHWGLSNAAYGVGPDDRIGPLEISGTSEFPAKDAIWNTATKFRIECKYPNDVELVITGGDDNVRKGTKWTGTDGWVWVDRSGFEASNMDWIIDIAAREKKEDLKVALYQSPGHQREFIDSIKSRKPTLTPAAVAHRSQTPGHLGYVASVVGRKLKWDAEKQQIIDDAAATKLLSGEMRSPWQLT